MKNYPFRYGDELEEDIDYLKKLGGYGASKNKALQDAVKIAAASVKKFLYGHKSEADHEKADVVRKKLGISKIFGQNW